jgi:hypothetical protein
MVLLGPTQLFFGAKSSYQTVFNILKYQKIPTYTPILRPTRLLISEKTSHIHGY